jgi:predicted TIM-barrel fold metal-dependent hydrolase
LGVSIVDSHAHIMLDAYASLPPVAPETVMEGFARYGVDQAWFSSSDALVHNDTDYHRRSNDRMAELQQRFAPRFVALATVNPRSGDDAARELERAVAELGMRGLKLHGWLQPVSCTDPCLQPLLAAADRLKLPVLFHDGTPPFTSSLQIGWLAEQYRGCKMILGHGGLKDLAVTAAQTAHRHDNVYLQTCATTLLSLRRALELVGPEKILYGSDGGFADMQWVDYNIRKIRKWQLPESVENKILGGNAKRLLDA